MIINEMLPHHSITYEDVFFFTEFEPKYNFI